MPRPVMLAFVSVCVVRCAGDPEPEPEPEQTCAQSETRILTIADEMTAELASPCDVDADCEIVGISAACPNGESFGMPDEAIAFARFAEARAFVAARADEVCLPERCGFPRYDNFYEYAYCDEGTCRGTTGSPDRVCPSLATSVTANADDLAQQLPHACGVDEDCVVYTPGWTCDEFELRAQGCAVVLAVDEDIDAQLQSNMASLCQERNFPCDAIDSCDEVAAACIDGVCVNNEG